MIGAIYSGPSFICPWMLCAYVVGTSSLRVTGMQTCVILQHMR